MDRNTTTDLDVQAATAWPRVAMSDDLRLDWVASMEFAARFLAQGLAHATARRWPTTAESLERVLPHAAMTACWRARETALLELAPLFGSECLAYVWLGDGEVFARVAARDLPVVAEAEAWLREQFPERAPTADQAVPVVFWSASDSGGYALSRGLDVPTWAEIRANYPSTVRAALEQLFAATFHPGDGGKLVLWHGEPGTGKTHALRALAWEWRAWCELHYVTDPEQFFGGRTDYLMDVVLREPDSGPEEKWRLLVLEDTGELLAADAKERTGQGLSRLLNVVDGVIGQGLRVLVLVTTNESLKRLHPAVARPGRCAFKVEFRTFPAEEASAWLRDRGLEAESEGGTLAELYARAAGRLVAAARTVGFGA
jgi:ATPase family associated with various cellular activities (AAA)